VVSWEGPTRTGPQLEGRMEAVGISGALLLVAVPLDQREQLDRYLMILRR